MSSQNLISLTSVSNVRLGHFRAQQELARNFYDDHEFCPLTCIEEATEHRERIQKRTLSPNYSFSAPPCYYTPPVQQHSHQYYQKNISPKHINRAIPIIDPSNMTSVAVPPHPTSGSTSPPMTQWSTYNSDLLTSLSPSSSHSSIGSTSSSTSSISDANSNISNSTIHHMKSHNSHYYFNNCAISYQYQIQPQPQKQIMPAVARAIPIVDPTTKQVFRHQHHHQQKQNPNVHPSFYNVSVC